MESAEKRTKEVLEAIIKDLDEEIKDAQNYGYPNAYNGFESGLRKAKALVNKRLDQLEGKADV